MPDQTQPMPPQQPQHPAGVPQGAVPPQGGQGGPPAGAGTPSVAGAYAGGPGGTGSGQVPPGGAAAGPGLWKQATSTTGGKVATTIAFVLAGLLLLGVMATSIFAIARIADRGDQRRENVAELREGMRDGMPGMGQRGNGKGNGQGNGQGNGGRLRGDGVLPGLGMLGTLGQVQHGEFTATGTDGKPVVLLVQRGAVTSASASSVAVRSDDGFAQTYALNASTRVSGGSAANLVAGDEVVVVARKEGRVALQVVQVRGAR